MVIIFLHSKGEYICIGWCLITLIHKDVRVEGADRLFVMKKKVYLNSVSEVTESIKSFNMLTMYVHILQSRTEKRNLMFGAALLSPQGS